MDRKLLATVGEYTAAKLDFLAAGKARIDPETGERGAIYVNHMHCRPLHPHGMRMVKAGLFEIDRGGLSSSRHTRLVITDAGLAELARLEKRLARAERRHGSEETGYVRPGTGRKPVFRQRSKAERDALRTRAIAWLKSAPKAAHS